MMGSWGEWRYVILVRGVVESRRLNSKGYGEDCRLNKGGTVLNSPLRVGL